MELAFGPYSSAMADAFSNLGQACAGLVRGVVRAPGYKGLAHGASAALACAKRKLRTSCLALSPREWPVSIGLRD